MDYRKLWPALVMFLALLIGCSKLSDTVTPDTGATKESVAYLKAWYLSQITLPPSPGVRTKATALETILPLLDWENVAEAKLSGSSAFVVPIGDTRKDRFSTVALKGCRRLLLWKDKQERNHANIVEFYTTNQALSESQIMTNSRSVATGMRAGRIKEIPGFDGNIALYNENYSFLSGRAFQGGRAIGTFQMRVTSNGKTKANFSRLGSTLAATNSCDYQDCTSYCGTVCVDGGGCHQDCTCESTGPSGGTTPADPGPPANGGGGYGGGTGGSSTGSSDDGTSASGPCGTPDGWDSVGDHAVLCEGKYMAGKLRVLVEMTSSSHSVEKITVVFNGVLPPGAAVNQVGDGTAYYSGGQYIVHVYFNVTGLDGVTSSKEGYIDISIHSEPDYFSESGWWDYYTMTRHGG